MRRDSPLPRVAEGKVFDGEKVEEETPTSDTEAEKLRYDVHCSEKLLN